MRTGRSGHSGWKVLWTVMMLVFAGFVIQSIRPPQASALLKEIVKPVLDPETSGNEKPKSQPQTSSVPKPADKEAASSEGGVSVPSLKVDTPILKAETPEVKLAPRKDKPGLETAVSSVKVETPVMEAEATPLTAEVAPVPGSLPEVTVSLPP
ncbi:hypothetical protein N6H14_03825 [Paenibacillus sp. CC-CFT747]|nr:hypothetical protein N6H14_03825 [Paenibacillus sp. CC-CFT747]